jgi:hypothetical protein
MLGGSWWVSKGKSAPVVLSTTVWARGVDRVRVERREKVVRKSVERFI